MAWVCYVRCALTRQESLYTQEKRALTPSRFAGPASETMSRVFLQTLHDAHGSNGGSLLNASAWASLAGRFERDGLITPLDSILVGQSRVRKDGFGDP